MNGEFVAWDDAKVHVLSHGLHYGTGVFEGIRCYETDRGPAIFRHRDHLDAARDVGRALLPAAAATTREELREATHELIRRNGLDSCYIRPLAFRGYGEMGLYAQSAPVDVIDRGLALGRLPRRGGQAPRHPRQGLVLAADLAGRPDPAREGLGPVPELDPRQDRGGQRRLRRGDPARRERHRLRGLGREHLRRPRRRARRPPATPPRSSTGSRRKSVIQIAADLGYEVVERDIARAELYLAEEVVPRRHRRRAGAGARDRRPRAGRAGRGHPADPGEVRGRPARAAPRSTRSGWTWSSNRVRSPADARLIRGDRAN